MPVTFPQHYYPLRFYEPHYNWFNLIVVPFLDESPHRRLAPPSTAYFNLQSSALTERNSPFLLRGFSIWSHDRGYILFHSLLRKVFPKGVLAILLYSIPLPLMYQGFSSTSFLAQPWYMSGVDPWP